MGWDLLLSVQHVHIRVFQALVVPLEELLIGRLKVVFPRPAPKNEDLARVGREREEQAVGRVRSVQELEPRLPPPDHASGNQVPKNDFAVSAGSKEDSSVMRVEADEGWVAWKSTREYVFCKVCLLYHHYGVLGSGARRK
eukprot:1364902-Amorphochlora_amoeboformis.AAC.1